jgi:hypothetical protein
MIRQIRVRNVRINVQKVILWWLRPHTPARDCRLWTLDKGFKQTLSEFLPFFLQKERGFQGKALRISTGEKAFCTLFTDEHNKKSLSIAERDFC